MKVLLVGSYSISWMAKGWSRALTEQEVEVIDFDVDRFYSKGFRGYIEKRAIMGKAIKKINEQVLSAAYHFKPDVILIYAVHSLYPKTIKRLSVDFWVASYENDDPFGGFGEKAFFRYWKKSIGFFNSNHVFREQNIIDYKSNGAKYVSLLLPFYIPWEDRPVKISKTDIERYSHEVVFVGHAENDERIEYIKKLVDSGVKIKIYGGAYWRRYLPQKYWKKLRPINTVVDIDYRKVIMLSKICLAFFSRKNRDQCSFRSFEITATGGFMLCKRTKLMSELYEEKKECEMFSTFDELLEKCRYYIKNEDIRNKIANAGHLRCLQSDYSIYNRMNQWVNETTSWMNRENRVLQKNLSQRLA